MWQVQNKKNIALLKKFEDKIINPLFDFIIEVKKNDLRSDKLDDIETIIKSSSSLPESYPNHLFSIHCEHNKTRHSLKDLIISIIKNYSTDQICCQYNIYKEQNNKIGLGNYSLNAEVVYWEFYAIFSKIFYDKCFDDLKCWVYIGEKTNFSRAIFHKNFKDENSEICCLCDIDSTIAKSNGIVEHFLPRNTFPYLSMSGYNLTTSCHGCNLSEEGKGTSVYSPIYSPYNIQIGDDVKFTFKSGRKIILSSKSNSNEVKNYIKLIKLNERYCTESVFNASLNRLKAEYESFTMTSKLSNSTYKFDNILSFVELRKTEGFYFLKKHLFSALPESEINKLFVAFKKQYDS